MNRFTKIAISVVLLLFGIIILLGLYVFNLMPSGKNPPTKNSPASAKDTSVILIKKLQVYANTNNTWNVKAIPKSDMQILTAIELSARMYATFADTAPSSASAGIVFSNGLEEKDPNLRKLSLYYYKKNLEWLLRYQSGTTSTFYGVLKTPENKAAGDFSLLVAADGKKVTITLPDKRTKTFSFPSSLYQVSNQMNLETLVGPKSTLYISSLSYENLEK